MNCLFYRPDEQRISDEIEAWHDRNAHLYENKRVRFTTPSLHTALQGEAQILLQSHWLPSGDTVVEVEWFGPVNAPVRIPEELFMTRLRGQIKGYKQLPERITGLPWTLRLIEGDGYRVPIHMYFVRTDAEAHPLVYPYWRARVEVRRAWQWFSIRSLLTLGLWGMLDWEENCVRSWRGAFGPQRRWLKSWLTTK